MADDYITGGEFARWRTEEQEFRRGVTGDLKELLGLVRTQNGRLYKAENCIDVIRREIEAIKSEDGAIQRTVESIQRDGCHQYEKHADVVATLDGAGVLPNTNGHARPAFRLPSLSPKQKAAAGVGIGALLLPAVSDLFKLATALVTWLHQAAGAVR